jgi:hypothetical protein
MTTAEITAQDLSRWFCGPWCPKCGWIEHVGHHLLDAGHPGGPDHCPHDARLSLHARWPETRPEGLAFGRTQIGMRCPLCEDSFQLPPAQAAALLAWGVVQAAPGVQIGTHIDHRPGAQVGNGKWGFASTLPEAIALAAHRYLDEQEAPHAE